MKIINFIMTILFIVNVTGYVLNYDDEDHIFDMLLSDNYIPYEPKNSTEMPENKDHIPVFVNGVWLCGNCSNISEINLLYNESYDIETTYDEEMELQIGFSLDNMRCIRISADEDVEVKVVSGACAGDAVTLQMINANNCDIRIYS